MDNNLITAGDANEPLIPANLCEICYESRELQDLQCSHGFCTACLRLYFKDKVLDGNVLVVKCPKTECLAPVHQETIRDLLDEEWFERYLLMYERKSKESNIYFRWCPQRNCQGFDEFKGDNKLVCGACKSEFCFLCSEEWHQGRCKNPFGANGKEFYEWARDKNVKLCPQCRLPVEKNGGCPNMNCTKCGFGFCWLCMQSTSDHDSESCFRHSQGFNMHWFMILMLVFLPLSFVFSYFVLAVIYILNLRESGNLNHPVLRSSAYRYSMLVASFIFSPVFMALGLALIPVLTLIIVPIALTLLRNSTCSSYLIFQLAALVLSPILISLFLIVLALALVIGPIVGLGLFLFKLYYLIKYRSNGLIV